MIANSKWRKLVARLRGGRPPASPPPFEGPTRFLGDQSANLDVYRASAESYAAGLSPIEAAGLKQKPFDWSAGHPAFFGGMYQMLNGIEALRLPPNGSVIEVGSGAGWVTCYLMGLGYRVTCVEPSSTMIAVARENLADFARRHAMEPLIANVQFAAAAFEACNISGESADGVLFYESFHHLADERRAADQAYRLLRPGGRLVIAGDSNWSPGNDAQAQAWTAEMDRYGTLESPFTAQYLEHLLTSAGFKEVTFHHGVNGLFPITGQDATIADSATSSALHLNNVTARRD